jgi:prepilin-type N-terminal cleavage/methylation domain-containing protein
VKFFKNGFTLNGFTMNGEKGFTLIELLVVVSILGVFVAVAVPNIVSMISSGDVAAANAELASVETAISAAMANAKASTVTGTTISSGADIVPAVSGYIAGTKSVLKGTYTIAADGSVTSAINTALGVIWDGPTHQFK